MNLNEITSEINNKTLNFDNTINFSVACLDHNHIYGMCDGLIAAGGKLISVYEPNDEKFKKFKKKYKITKRATHFSEILEDNNIQLVACAAIPNKRSSYASRTLKAGKNFFVDKTAFTEYNQIIEIERIANEKQKMFFVYFNERIHKQTSYLADYLIENQEIGDVLNVSYFGPHKLSNNRREEWFFDKDKNGGILVDIGLHAIEQFIHLTKEQFFEVKHSLIKNELNAIGKEFQNYADATIVSKKKVTLQIRVDWLTPNGLPTWGDVRSYIYGTKGYIEIRKNIDLLNKGLGEYLFLVNEKGSWVFKPTDIKYSFFNLMIHDCLHNTEYAMKQSDIFLSSKLAFEAQKIGEYN